MISVGVFELPRIALVCYDESLAAAIEQSLVVKRVRQPVLGDWSLMILCLSPYHSGVSGARVFNEFDRTIHAVSMAMCARASGVPLIVWGGPEVYSTPLSSLLAKAPHNVFGLATHLAEEAILESTDAKLIRHGVILSKFLPSPLLGAGAVDAVTSHNFSPLARMLAETLVLWKNSSRVRGVGTLPMSYHQVAVVLKKDNLPYGDYISPRNLAPTFTPPIPLSLDALALAFEHVW